MDHDLFVTAAADNGDDGGDSHGFSYDVGGADSSRDGCGADGGDNNDSECLWSRHSASIILITSYSCKVGIIIIINFIFRF